MVSLPDDSAGFAREKASWRSMLFVPANNSRFVKKAKSTRADAIVLDLEDSIPSSEKRKARESLATSIESLAQHYADILVRVDSQLGNAIRDIESATRHEVCAIILPKTSSVGFVREIDAYLLQLEDQKGLIRRGIGLLPMIECPEGLARVDSIVNEKRVVGVAFGSEDFADSIGVEPCPRALTYACQKVIVAAKRVEKVAFGYPDTISRISEFDELRRSAKLGRAIGFEGAFAIHPNQVEILNEAYSLSDAEVRHAESVVLASDIARENGKAVFSMDGRMVDEPVVRRARRKLMNFRLQQRRR